MSASRIVSKVARWFGTNGEGTLQYECLGCGRGFDLEYHSCPDCGNYRVERTDWVVD